MEKQQADPAIVKPMDEHPPIGSARGSSSSNPIDPLPDTRITARDWRPIETAPKDGRWLLVVDRVRIAGDGLTLARFDADFGINHWYSGFDGGYEDDEPLNPTHWMPLPAPPVPDPGTALDNRFGDTLKYTAAEDGHCTACSGVILKGALCYRYGDWGGNDPHTFQHLWHVDSVAHPGTAEKQALTCRRCRLPPNAIMHMRDGDGTVIHPEGHVFDPGTAEGAETDMVDVRKHLIGDAPDPGYPSTPELARLTRVWAEAERTSRARAEAEIARLSLQLHEAQADSARVSAKYLDLASQLAKLTAGDEPGVWPCGCQVRMEREGPPTPLENDARCDYHREMASQLAVLRKDTESCLCTSEARQHAADLSSQLAGLRNQIAAIHDDLGNAYGTLPDVIESQFAAALAVSHEPEKNG